MKDIKEYEDLFIYYFASNVIKTDTLKWSEKYDLIFSDNISGKVTLDYVDPDTSYEDDINAFMKALNEQIANQI